ncbi:unnamed protein product [Owenia fusiformis]|uniref:Uncharacterized protein n=1 Tax=Owenia fusiformis TaxID=6347 RepID=A0A8J1ULJ1_OWEFU|nr:unnamed protein product [Owenia fusiformis]
MEPEEYDFDTYVQDDSLTEFVRANNEVMKVTEEEVDRLQIGDVISNSFQPSNKRWKRPQMAVKPIINTAEDKEKHVDDTPLKSSKSLNDLVCENAKRTSQSNKKKVPKEKKRSRKKHVSFDEVVYSSDPSLEGVEHALIKSSLELEDFDEINISQQEQTISRDSVQTINVKADIHNSDNHTSLPNEKMDALESPKDDTMKDQKITLSELEDNSKHGVWKVPSVPKQSGLSHSNVPSQSLPKQDISKDIKQSSSPLGQEFGRLSGYEKKTTFRNPFQSRTVGLTTTKVRSSKKSSRSNANVLQKQSALQTEMLSLARLNESVSPRSRDSSAYSTSSDDVFTDSRDQESTSSQSGVDDVEGHVILQVVSSGNVEALHRLTNTMDAENLGSFLDRHGNNVLHLCCSSGHLESLEYLHQYLSPTSTEMLAEQNRKKLTPFGCAVKRGHVDCLVWLLEQDGNEEILGNDTQRLLHIAAKHNQFDCLHILATIFQEDQSVINSMDVNRLTPLHIAAKYGRLECMQVLIDFGADVFSKNADGLTASELALINGHSQCSKYLQSVETCVEFMGENIKLKLENDRLLEEQREFERFMKQTMEAVAKVSTVMKTADNNVSTVAQLKQEFEHVTNRLARQVDVLYRENTALKQNTNGGVKSNALEKQIQDTMCDNVKLGEDLDKFKTNQPIEPPGLAYIEALQNSYSHFNTKLNTSRNRTQRVKCDPSHIRNEVRLHLLQLQLATVKATETATANDNNHHGDRNKPTDNNWNAHKNPVCPDDSRSTIAQHKTNTKGTPLSIIKENHLNDAKTQRSRSEGDYPTTAKTTEHEVQNSRTVIPHQHVQSILKPSDRIQSTSDHALFGNGISNRPNVYPNHVHQKNTNRSNIIPAENTLGQSNITNVIKRFETLQTSNVGRQLSTTHDSQTNYSPSSKVRFQLTDPPLNQPKHKALHNSDDDGSTSL